MGGSTMELGPAPGLEGSGVQPATVEGGLMNWVMTEWVFGVVGFLVRRKEGTRLFVGGHVKYSPPLQISAKTGK